MLRREFPHEFHVAFTGNVTVTDGPFDPSAVEGLQYIIEEETRA